MTNGRVLGEEDRDYKDDDNNNQKGPGRAMLQYRMEDSEEGSGVRTGRRSGPDAWGKREKI